MCSLGMLKEGGWKVQRESMLSPVDRFQINTIARQDEFMLVRLVSRVMLMRAVSFVVLAASVGVLIATHAVSSYAASHIYVRSGNGKQANVTAFATWYGFNDNSGQTEEQHNSADIAYPKSDGHPTLHNLTTEGKGTYIDPVTFAVRKSDLKTFPIGSIIYVPLVKKYFIMEDQCGDDDPEGCLRGTHHVDLWMGPASLSNGSRLDNCEVKATPRSPIQVIINPSPRLPVDITKMFTRNKCTIHLY